MRLWHFILVSAIVAVVSLSGCVNPSVVSPTPAPVSTPAPTPLPTTDGPVTIGTEHGTQVRLINVTVTPVEVADPEGQAENFTLTFENIGNTPVNNMGFNFKEKDLRTGQDFFSDVYLVGTIPANSKVAYQLTTPKHKISYSVTTEIEIYWGEKVEYSSTYLKTFTLGGLPVIGE